MRTINYESDFKLIEGFKDGSSIYEAPFRFTYYTKLTRGSYVAEYNGINFTNCRPTEDGKLIVPFDNPNLGMGVLNVKREFFLNDADFGDGVCKVVSIEDTGIVLDKGPTSDLGEIELLVEKFYHSIGSGYEPPEGGIPREDLAEDVQTSLGKADTALQEAALSEYAKKSEMPTNTSELTNDSGYITEGRVEEMIDDKVTSANVTNIVSITQADYDALESKDETTLYLITE